MKKDKYVITIYDESKSNISLENWDYENLKDLSLKETHSANNKDELLKIWDNLYKKYEGWSYSIKNYEKDICLVAGVFDLWDREILESEK